MASRPFGPPPPPPTTDFDFVATCSDASWSNNGGFFSPNNWSFSSTQPTNSTYTYPDGTTGKTYDFDGTTWAISPPLSSTGAWDDDQIAVSIWFYPTAFGVQLLVETDSLPSADGSGNGYQASVLEIDSSGFIHARFYNGTAAVSTTKVILNQWNHVYFAEIWTTDHYFEVNGIPTNGAPNYHRESVKDLVGGTERFTIGGYTVTNINNTGRFQGKIGHVSISDWVAPSTYNTFVNRYIPAPLALSLDASVGNSYSGSQPGYWTDTVQNKLFTLYGSTLPTYSTDGGGSLVFAPGNGNYAEAPSLASASRWTVETWHYYDGTNESGSPCIVTEIWDYSPINYTLGVTDDTTIALKAGFFTNNSWAETSNNQSLTAGNWYHLVASFDSTNLDLYINGTRVERSTWPGATPTSSGLGIRLMRRWDTDQKWGGKLAIVRIYTGALIESNIQANYDAEKARFGL